MGKDREFAIYSRQILIPDSDGNPKGFQEGAIHIRGGKINKVCSLSELPQYLEIENFSDNIILPGFVDTHCHINEPGRTEWEGFETATRAAAAGGVTTVVDMPLNSIPPTTTLLNLMEKAEYANGHCFVDYSFWGGVIPGNSHELESMIQAGVRGFKCFLCPSGVEEFPNIQSSELSIAMSVLARHQIPLLVHAELVDESDSKTETHLMDYQCYLRSRPKLWELRAVQLMIELCQKTSCPVHIVHLSAAEAIPILMKAKADGLPITFETCPHYLLLNAEDIPKGATHFKCAPPIRENENREKLWEAIRLDQVDFIVSDHSPCHPGLKLLDQGDFEKSWGGISSLQLSVSAIWTEMKKRGFTVVDLSRLMSYRPARFAGFRNKGAILTGLDADLVVFDPESEFTVQSSQLFHRHTLTPYLGKQLNGSVRATYLNGVKIFQNGRHLGLPNGKLILSKEPSNEIRDTA